MGKISMVMFDLSGTTVYDDTGVRDSLYKAAVEFKVKTTPEETLFNMGTNKIHLYQFLITNAIMDSLGWVKRGLVDLAVDVEDIPGGIGRPAPFMLFHAMTHFNVQSVPSITPSPSTGLLKPNSTASSLEAPL